MPKPKTDRWQARYEDLTIQLEPNGTYEVTALGRPQMVRPRSLRAAKELGALCVGVEPNEIEWLT